MKKEVPVLVMFIISLLGIYSCEDTGINSGKPGVAKFLSYKENGCVKKSGLEKKNSSIIEANYSNGVLDIKLNFTTYCSAKMKDSVKIESNLISIFLKDVNDAAAKCVCPHQEEFKFGVMGSENLRIKFSYDAYASSGYKLLADTLISIK